MFARLIHDLTKGRLRLPLRTGASVTKGDTRLDGRVPRLVSDESTPRDMRLLTDLDLNTPGNPPALRADGTLDPGIIPNTNNSGSGTGAAGELLGEIRAWAGQPLRAPAGWLVCDGTEILISAYPGLFAVLGNQWGRPTNPALRFKLPNLVGRVLIGGPGPNDSSQGRVHKINVRTPGSNYTPGVYSATLLADAPASFSSPASVNITVALNGRVEKVDIITGGQASGVQPNLSGIAGESNCSIRIPGGTLPIGSGFTYDVYLTPTALDVQPWGVKMTNRGIGYASIPSVTISGPSITGATAVAVLDSGGDIREVIVTNPGTGDPTGATVTFTGGAPGTPATADIITWASPTVPGDTGGEQQHLTLMSEMPLHHHQYSQESGSPPAPLGGDFSGGGLLNTSDTGGDRPMNLRPPYAGVTYLIRAA